MKTILYGAFGRHNLGDMLFPYIVECLLKENNIKSKIEYCDINKIDMKVHGGNSVKSITEFFEYKDKLNIISVGGHIGNGCNPFDFFSKSIKNEFLPEFTKRKINPSYIIQKSKIKMPNKFIANAIGGYDSSCLDSLKNYDYVSFRNLASYNRAKKDGIKCELVPDSVVLLKYFLDKKIKTRNFVTSNLNNLKNKLNNRYISIQINKEILKENKSNLFKCVSNLISKTDIPVVFFCAGFADHHDSINLYKQVFQKKLPQDYVHFFEGTNIWDICNLINNSTCVIGTSLHVRIISGVYNRPRVTLFSNHADSKAKEFIEQWDNVPVFNQRQSLAKYVTKEIKEHDYEKDEKHTIFLQNEYLKKSTWVNLL